MNFGEFRDQAIFGNKVFDGVSKRFHDKCMVQAKHGWHLERSRMQYGYFKALAELSKIRAQLPPTDEDDHQTSLKVLQVL